MDVQARVRDVYETCELSRCQPTSLNWLSSRSGYEVHSVTSALGELVNLGCISVSETDIGVRPIRVKCIFEPSREKEYKGTRKAGSMHTGKVSTPTRKLLELLSKNPDGVFKQNLVRDLSGGDKKKRKAVYANIARCINMGYVVSESVPSNEISIDTRYSFDGSRIPMGASQLYRSVFNAAKRCCLFAEIKELLNDAYTQKQVSRATLKLKEWGAITEKLRVSSRVSMLKLANKDVVKDMYNELSRTHKEIYDHLLSEHGLNNVFLQSHTKVSAAVGCSYSDVFKAVRKLKSIGVIEQVGESCRGKRARLKIIREI